MTTIQHIELDKRYERVSRASLERLAAITAELVAEEEAKKEEMDARNANIKDIEKRLASLMGDIENEANGIQKMFGDDGAPTPATGRKKKASEE